MTLPVTYLLAGAAGFDGLTVSVAAIAALGTAAAAIVTAFRRGQKSAERRQVKLEEPVPDVPVVRKYSPPTFWQHRALEERVVKIETKCDAMELRMAENFTKLLEDSQQRELRLIEKLDGIARGIHQRIDNLTGKNHE